MATSRTTPPKRPSSGRPSAARARTKPAGAWSPLANVPTKYHTPIFIGLILLSLLIFFSGVIFGGKFFATSDNISWLSFVPFLDMMEAKGEHPFWIPYIFSGMPAYAAYLVTGDRWWDLIMKILGMTEQAVGLGNFWVMRVIFHYFIYGSGMYLLMRSKKAARSTSLFVSLAAMFSTWVIVYIMIGHNTKISVLMTFPFIFLCLEQLIKRWSLLYTGLLIAAIHVMLAANHLQSAFYGLCAIGIYLLFMLIGALLDKSEEKSRNTIRILLTTGIVLVAGAFSYGMELDRYLAVQEYTPYSTRGAKALVPDPTHADDPADGGHGYKYATEWSFSPEETITYVVPSYFGFGKMEYEVPGGQTQEVMPYWGQMPFTDAAHYMGIGVLILGIFGAWMNRRNRFVQALLAIGLFGLVLSYGRNLSLLYDFFYYSIPNFNKFRAPSQSLVLLEFAFPILAGFGIETLLAMRRSEDNPQADKSLLYSIFAFGGFILLGLVAVNIGQSSYYEAIAAAAKEKGRQDLTQLQEFIFSNMQTDWLLAGLFGVGTLLLMYLYVRGRVSPILFKLGLIGILLFDLWRVGFRPMNAVPKEEAFAVFNPTDIDEFLHKDTTKYRILDVTVQGPNYPARQFHEHIMGYHAAKMRNYQDLMDVAGNAQLPTSRLAWQLLNMKYVIAQQPVDSFMTPVFQSNMKPQTYVFQFDRALPRAWFVNRVEVADAMGTLNKIKNNEFDPRDVAYVTKQLDAKIDPVGYSSSASPSPAAADTALARTDTTLADSTAAATTPAPTVNAGNGRVSVTLHEPNHIVLDVEAPGNNFLVVSEVHYPPSWRATIDDKPAEIIQTNYLLRGLVVPPGKHTIKMDYVSPGFETGKWVSLTLNLLTLGMIGAGFFMRRKRPEDADPRHDAPVIEEDDV